MWGIFTLISLIIAMYDLHLGRDNYAMLWCTYAIISAIFFAYHSILDKIDDMNKKIQNKQ